MKRLPILFLTLACLLGSELAFGNKDASAIDSGIDSGIDSQAGSQYQTLILDDQLTDDFLGHYINLYSSAAEITAVMFR